MSKENIQKTGEIIFSLIDMHFGNDAAFERAANLPPKTVSNWRRGRSSSFMKLLPELAALFWVSVQDLLGAEGEDYEPTFLSPDEKQLLALYRSADALSDAERAALQETLRNTVDLYLNSRPEGKGRRK